MKPWLWTGCMTKLSPGRQQTTNWSDDNVALRKRGSLLIRCPASHAFMCERGAEQGDDLARAACRARGATGLPERGDPVLPVGQGAVKASAPSDRRDGGQPVAPGGAGLARSGHSIRCLFPGEWRMAGPQARRSGGPRARGRSGGGDRHVRYPRRPIHLQPRRPLSWFEDKHCRVRDSPVLPELPEQIPESEERGTVTADSACDIRRCHTAIIARQASAVIPIRKNGRPCKEDCPAARARNETLRAPRHSGRAGPEAHDRMPCPQPDQSQDARLQGLRRTHRRKDPDRQTEEICIRIALLNRFNAQGTAEIVRLD